VLPVIAGSGASPELLVLATTAGSLMFSHFNDIGFWMFKEYYNVSVRETFQIWTVMESIVAVVGLAGTLLLSTVVHAAPAAKHVAYVNSYHQGYPSSDEAAAAMKAQLAKRGVAEEDFMVPYAAFGLTEIATEQGVWAGPTALAILAGASPASIAVTANRQSRCFFKGRLAKLTRGEVPPSLNCSEHKIVPPGERAGDGN
jgi:hypothetical protein